MRLSHRVFLFAIMSVFVAASMSHACPNCFASSKSQALEAYYVSIAFMALIPFTMIAALVFWVRRRLRQTN